MTMVDQWDDDIADDEYWANLFKQDLAHEREKLIESLDAQKHDAEEKDAEI
jgi:hypothetical protein